MVSGWQAGASTFYGTPVSLTVRPPLSEPIDSTNGEIEQELQQDISSDGRWVSFVGVNHGTYGNERFNRAQVYLRDTLTGGTELITHAADGSPDLTHPSSYTSVSENGKYIAYTQTKFTPATPPLSDRQVNQVIWHDVDNDVSRVIFETPPVPANATVPGATPDISDDGKTVAFAAYHLDGGYFVGKPAVWNVDSNATDTLDQVGSSTRISGDGHFVTFTGTGSTSDVYRWNPASPTAELVSAAEGGEPGDGSSSGSSISDDGRWVAFASGSTNLTTTGLSPAMRFYLRDMTTGTTSLVSSTATASAQIEISPDASTVAYVLQSATGSVPYVMVADRLNSQCPCRLRRRAQRCESHWEPSIRAGWRPACTE